MVCKKCGCRVPSSHQGEYGMHKCLCRKCWAILTSKWKDVKNTASDLLKEE